MGGLYHRFEEDQEGASYLLCEQRQTGVYFPVGLPYDRRERRGTPSSRGVGLIGWGRGVTFKGGGG